MHGRTRAYLECHILECDDNADPIENGDGAINGSHEVDLKQLRALVTVAQTGNVTRASALLNVLYFPSQVPIPGMELLPGEGMPVYHNPRAVPG